VGGPVALAVPVLDTAVGVWVPAVRLAGAVEWVITVNNLAWSLGHTVLPTRSTDRPLPAVRVLGVVAALVGGVEHLGVAFLIVRTEEVFWLTVRGGAVPVPPAVELVSEPAGPGLLAVDVLLRGAAVGGGGDSWSCTCHRWDGRHSR